MKAVELVKKYQRLLSSEKLEDRYSALLFALQIPSICGRIEFPNNDTNNEFYDDNKPKDEKLYLAWITKHAISFKPWFYTISTVKDIAEKIYKLRCQLTHEGYILQDNTKIVFISDNKNTLFVDDIVMISIPEFCNEFFMLAENIFTEYDTEFSSYDGLTISNNIYEQIYQDVTNKYSKFWAKKNVELQTLYMIYSFVFYCNPNKAKEVKQYFKQHPSDYYEIEDFGSQYSIVIPDNKYFFESFKNTAIGRISTITCRFKKSDYIKMTKLNNDLEIYSKKDRISINKYI